MQLIRFNQAVGRVIPTNANKTWLTPRRRLSTPPAPTHDFTIGGEADYRGFKDGVAGAISPATHSGHTIQTFGESFGAPFEISFGALGDEQIAGVTEIAVAIQGFSPFIATWNAVNTQYEATELGLWAFLDQRVGQTLTVQLTDQ